MSSIRAKVFWTFTAVVLIILVLTVLLNSVLYKPFAINQDKRVFREVEAIITEEANTGQISTELLSNVSAGYGVQLDILDRLSNQVVYSSSAMMSMGHGQNQGQGRGMRYRTNYQRLDLSTDKEMGFRQVRSSDGDDILMLMTPINQSVALAVYRPIAIIDRTVDQVNRFVLLVGLGLLAIGSALIYWLAGKQVKPILELQEQTASMAKLDFSSRFDTNSNDEIAKLGENINAISDKLSATIQTLESDVQKLTEVDRVRKQFIATVSHEFKSPLGIIKGYTEALKYKLPSPDEEEKYYNTIISETDRMNSLVQDLIAQMKRELDHQASQLVPVRVCDFLDRVISRHKGSNPERSFKLTCQQVEVLMDESEITRVMDNFLQNAYVYGDENSPIEIQTSLHQGSVEISIINQGPRIPEDQRQAIWDSFYKLDPARGAKSPGTGLGLAINKSIVESHGGSVGCENLPKGVRFFFRLQRAK